jgi:hypothetical protein
MILLQAVYSDVEAISSVNHRFSQIEVMVMQCPFMIVECV